LAEIYDNDKVGRFLRHECSVNMGGQGFGLYLIIKRIPCFWDTM